MAKCPKCGRHLRLIDAGQFCPGCGVNMRFYGFEENFYREAKLAELSQAVYHLKIRNFKVAFIGSKLTILRLIVVILPLVSFLLPAGSYAFSLPMKDVAVDFGVFGFITLFTGSDFSYINEMAGSALFGKEFSALRTAVFSYASVAVVEVIIVLLTLLCFISIKNMQKITAVFAGIGIADSFFAFFMIKHFAGVCSDSSFVSGKTGYGLFLSALMFVAVFVVNFLLIKKGIPVEYNEGMQERAEIYKKVKAGTVSLDDLPQPVVSTAETRKIEEEIAKEEEAYVKSHSLSTEEV